MAGTTVSADWHKDHQGRPIVTLWIKESGTREPTVLMLWPEEASQVAREIDIVLQDIDVSTHKPK